MSSVLRRRKTQQAELIALGRQFADRARAALGPVTVWVYGSVARGDFNVWSDVDVLLVAARLPADPLERWGLLIRLAPPDVEPKGYTEAEFRKILQNRKVQVLAMLRSRILLVDDLQLEAQLSKETEAPS
ncbi:MAG: nucleotidyltransferase domain-containing protein [Acidobacteria bacterium]|nr:nucleotidyltransferase domain-containing protein [Acidobacteriota bacterium]MDW7984591.1 nucleotidyltransferase domain-containing protein [Acidobacteriota bacterium]